MLMIFENFLKMLERGNFYLTPQATHLQFYAIYNLNVAREEAETRLRILKN